MTDFVRSATRDTGGRKVGTFRVGQAKVGQSRVSASGARDTVSVVPASNGTVTVTVPVRDSL